MPTKRSLMLACLAVLASCERRDGVRPPPAEVSASLVPVDAGAALAVARPWPSPQAVISLASLKLPPAFSKRRIYVDAGHGAPGNSGTLSVTCEQEQVYTLRAARELARRLALTGAFEVKLSREEGALPSYADRVAEAEAWRADAIISLHMDARGEAVAVGVAPDGRACMRSEGAPGFAVLWSDEAKAPLAESRHQLATSLAARLTSTGFVAYDGADYPGLYENDASVPGVFLDRHVPGRRIWFLRQPKPPVVIIETHHSLDPGEHALWQEPRTWDAFGVAVAAALVDFFEPGAPEGASARHAAAGARGTTKP